jgi:quercetin dioxygenase-like cupin family protein
MKRFSSNRKALLIATLCAIVIFAVTAYAVTQVRLAQGTIASSQILNGPALVTMTQITLQPGDVIPWHYHPGKVFVIVQSGAITEDAGCGGSEVLTAGQAFEEPIPRVHQVRNEGSVPAVLFATLISTPGQPLAINTGGPLCGPPINKDECKDGGWMNFNFPGSFASQGECVTNVNTGK